MRREPSSPDLLVESLISTKIDNEKFNIAIIGLDKFSGKVIFENKDTGAIHIAKFYIIQDLIPHKTDIRLVLSQAKFSVLKNEKLLGTHIINSAIHDFQDRLAKIENIF